MMKYLINITKLIKGRLGIELYILIINLNEKIKKYISNSNAITKADYVLNNTIFNTKKAQR